MWLKSLRRAASYDPSDQTARTAESTQEVIAAGRIPNAGSASKSLAVSVQRAPKEAFAPSILGNLLVPDEAAAAAAESQGIPQTEAAEDATFDSILHGRYQARKEKHRSYKVIPRFYFGSLQSTAAKAVHSDWSKFDSPSDAETLLARKRLQKRDSTRLRLLRSWLRSTARSRAVESRAQDVLEQGDLSDIVYILQALRRQIPVNPSVEDSLRQQGQENEDRSLRIPPGVPTEPRVDYESYCELRQAAPGRAKHLLTPDLFMQFDRDHKGRISSRQLFYYLCALVAAHRRGLQLASMAAQSGEQAAQEASKALRLAEAEDAAGGPARADAPSGANGGAASTGTGGEGSSPSVDRPALDDLLQEAEAAAQGPPSLSEQDLELYLQDVAKEAPALARLPPPFVVFYVYTGVRRIVFMLQASEIAGGDGVGGAGSGDGGDQGPQDAKGAGSSGSEASKRGSPGTPRGGAAGPGAGVDGGPKRGDAIGYAKWRAGRPSGRYSLSAVLACPAFAELGAIYRITAEEARRTQQQPPQGPMEAAARAAETSRVDPLLAGVPGGATSLNWFSDRSALRVYGRYLSLDQDRDGLLSQDEMAGWGGGRLTKWFVQRLFETCRTYDGMMDYRTYLDVELALAPRQMGGLPGHPSAVKMLFVCLDEDEKGYIDENDVARAFFHVQCRVAEAMNYRIVRDMAEKDSARLTPTGFAPFATKYCTADDIRAGRVENVLGTATFMAEFADMLGPWCIARGEGRGPGAGSGAAAGAAASSGAGGAWAGPGSPRPGAPEVSSVPKGSGSPKATLPGVLPIRATLSQLCRATLGYSALRCLVDVESFSSFDGKEAASSASPQVTDSGMVGKGAGDGVNFGIMEPDPAEQEQPQGQGQAVPPAVGQGP